MVTARRMHDLDLVGEALPLLVPVETAPRPLTAQELIDAAASGEERPELLLGLEARVSGVRSARPAG